MKAIELKLVETAQEMKAFWDMFSTYMHELAANATQGDGIDLEYFLSSEYSDAVESLSKRDYNPIRVYSISNNSKLIGFSMYQLLFDEGKNCCLMEFYIEEKERKQGLGKAAYDELEKHIARDGVHTIDLTPTNDVNKLFWQDKGFTLTSEIDEDNKPIYAKNLR